MNQRQRLYIGHPLVGDGSPNWGNVDRNIERYLHFVALALNNGYTVLSWVHKCLTHQRRLTKGSADFYLAGDLDMISLGNEFWIAGPVAVSNGLSREVTWAVDRQLDIRYPKGWDDPSYWPDPFGPLTFVEPAS